MADDASPVQDIEGGVLLGLENSREPLAGFDRSDAPSAGAKRHLIVSQNHRACETVGSAEKD
jgi:hypothetical protein